MSLPFVEPLFASSNLDLSNLHFSLKLLSIPEMQVCSITGAFDHIYMLICALEMLNSVIIIIIIITCIIIIIIIIIT